MIELLDKIETILATTPEQQMADTPTTNESEALLSHPLTSWTGDRIAQSLSSLLPAAKNAREQEAISALHHGKYSRCKIYPQLAEGSAYIKAIGCMSSIPQATELCLPTLPALFNETARAVKEAHDQVIAATEERGRLEERRDAAVASLEKLAIDVFAKGLGDDAEK